MFILTRLLLLLLGALKALAHTASASAGFKGSYRPAYVRYKVAAVPCKDIERPIVCNGGELNTSYRTGLITDVTREWQDGSSQRMTGVWSALRASTFQA